MKPLTRKSLASVACGFAFALLTLSPADARSQNPDTTNAQQQEGAESQTNPNDTAGLLKQLNLSPEQLTQIRAIQAESVPQALVLRRQLNQAQRAFNDTIYSDTADESLIEQRVRNVAEAQAAVLRHRAQTELRVRRVLTPEQFQTFLRIRQQALNQQREMRREQRIERQLDQDANPRRPARNALNNNQNRQNQKNAPAEHAPDERPLKQLRQQRRQALGKP